MNVRVPVNIKYKKPIGPNDKVEFVSGALFGVDRKLSDKSFAQWRQTFLLSNPRRGEDGTVVRPVRMTYLQNSPEVFWYVQKPGTEEPSRDDLINMAMCAVLGQNGAVEIIYQDEAAVAAPVAEPKAEPKAKSGKEK